MIKRRDSLKVFIGKLAIGGGLPVAIQSMTNTDTADVSATVLQVKQLADAGAELVRITVNNEAAADAVAQIKAKLVEAGYDVPLIGDFHYNGHLLLTKFPKCAQALDKYRINPGNIGSGALREENFKKIIECALKYDKPIRIGVNWGSLGEIGDSSVKSLVKVALESAKMAEKFGMASNKIVLSVKTSDVQETISAYRLLAKSCKYALHLGFTEAGSGMKGIIGSTAALAILLQEGIGDTIRVSLTPSDKNGRTEEVKVAQTLLQVMGLRSFRPMVTSCPGCGRTSNDRFQKLAQELDKYVDKMLLVWRKKYAEIENLKLAVMGCAVNGPGEAKHANIALCFPGKSEESVAAVFVDGKPLKTLRGGSVKKDFFEIIERYLAKKL
ncbi:flavodoxin-dependent (E)-4-hydroxy-3-methylbut-2-enyl-diphosphate synthase [Candidatus Peregrinibacteria bacterium]|nr:flavodoxin-dependent (E)-4-hydroxy-3-methylbut-2-enyl-diphosphate synthase [Candidatus Peregrinibacteria bacterium]